MQTKGTRSAHALPNTGSNAFGITFSSFGALVFGMFSAGAAVNRERAKYLR
ncbi:LPXTG-motif protein cell wall anchor domain protein [Gardnerella vaginalis JCP8151B]|nr:LPXTG-motif protein cell wall anchor domain protein [Gardnerella vaginalis JCP8151B]